MPIGLKAPQLKELKARIVVCGVGGAGGNAINNMIARPTGAETSAATKKTTLKMRDVVSIESAM
jgi:cell division GTPase FtsZ